MGWEEGDGEMGSRMSDLVCFVVPVLCFACLSFALIYVSIYYTYICYIFSLTTFARLLHLPRSLALAHAPRCRYDSPQPTSTSTVYLHFCFRMLSSLTVVTIGCVSSSLRRSAAPSSCQIRVNDIRSVVISAYTSNTQHAVLAQHLHRPARRSLTHACSDSPSSAAHPHISAQGPPPASVRRKFTRISCTSNIDRSIVTPLRAAIVY